GSPVWLTFLLLFFTLLLLSILEGSQIAIVSLADSEDEQLLEIRKSYPAAYSVMRLMHNKMRTQQYLAGRQFFVILTVFVIAQITSFPNVEYLPFTPYSISQIPGWMNLVCFKLGFLGALLVLWTAQLIPQYFANHHPGIFLNIPGNLLIVKLCLIIESIGPTKPANWVADILLKTVED
ncbi:hypothetical protein OAL13_01075, partial [bacterium]|nr:hypothetical protein [bacterium]